MKLAIIGSRGLTVQCLEQYLPPDVTEIISGGASWIDTCARECAQRKGLPLTELLPDYGRYGRGAPLRRNLEIIERADAVLAFWDGHSRGTRHIIEHCRRQQKKITVCLKQIVI